MLYWLAAFICLFNHLNFSYQEDKNDCRNGWTLISGACYKYFNNSETWINAEAICQQQSRDSHLASVKKRSELSKIDQMIANETDSLSVDFVHLNSNETDFVWLGLSLWCPEQKSVKWTDNTKVSKFVASKNYTRDSEPICIGFRNQSLINVSCHKVAKFVCKAPNLNLNTKSTKVSRNDTSQYETDDACGGWDWCRNGSQCFNIQIQQDSWSYAHENCVKQGGDLVSLDSHESENYLTERFIFSWNGSTFWTNANKNVKYAEDMLKLNFTNYTNNTGCISIEKKSESQELKNIWKITDCNEKLMSICLKSANCSLINDCHNGCRSFTISCKPNTTTQITTIGSFTSGPHHLSLSTSASSLSSRFITTTTDNAKIEITSNNSTWNSILNGHEKHSSVGVAIGAAICILIITLIIIFLVKKRKLIKNTTGPVINFDNRNLHVSINWRRKGMSLNRSYIKLDED